MGLSYADLEGLWVNAGGSTATAPMAAAIALAESGGNPNAFNGNTGTGDQSYGLWQINMLGSLGPGRLQEFGITNNNQLFDPATNAHAAVLLAGGGSNFSPWSTYKNGSYQRYLSGNVPPNLNANGGPSASPVSNSVTDIPSEIEHSVLNILNYVFMFAGIIAGLLFIGVGLVLLVKESPAGDAVTAARGAAGTLVNPLKKVVA